MDGTVPGAGFGGGSWYLQSASPESSACFIFGGPFPGGGTNAGIGALPVCVTSLNRSASKERSISFNVAGEVVGGALATTSNRSVSNQIGPPCPLLASTP